MKSLSELIRFLKGLRANTDRVRRSGDRTGAKWNAVEAVESRILLTVDVEDVIYNTQTIDDVAPTDQIESYLVKFQAPQDPTALQNLTAAVSVTSSRFVENAYTLEFTGGLTLQDAANVVGDLPDFEYLHPNIVYTAETEALPNDTLFNNQWHLLNTGQGNGLPGIDANTQGAWDIATGVGVTIGIVDEGVETAHPDFANNINTAIDFDWVDNDLDPNPTGANENHGTAVAGVASADGDNGLGVSGAAWDAELVGLRLLGGGGITERQIAEAITHEPQIIDIYNNSWGPGNRSVIQTTFGMGPEITAALRDGATTGRGGLGVIRVNSAGNGGQNSNSNYFGPTNSRFSIAVGALANTGQLAGYSTPGAPVVLVAPSNGGTLGITTVDRSGNVGYSTTDYANDFGGTSSAAPLVAGVVALMLDANPNLTYRDVVDILVHTSDQVDAADPSWEVNGAGLPVSHDYGFGKVDAAEAVSSAVNHVPLAPEQTFSSGLQAVNTQIPDLGTVSRTYTVSSANAISSLEWVEVVISATHQFVGDLEITVTSPDGTTSVLAETRGTDAGTRLSNYVFTTIHHYDESSQGTWTVTLTDGAAQDIGTFDSFELRFYGSNAVPVITQSNGTTVVTDAGGTDTFDISLPVRPSSDVVIDIVSGDTGEVVVDQPQITFTTTNWSTPQRITAMGVNDLIRDFDQTTNVRISVDASQSAAEYASAQDQFIQVTSIDNDHNLPRKLTFTSPVQLPGTAKPRFEWIGVVHAVKFELVVTNVFTGSVVQQRNDLQLPRHEFQSPFVDGIYQALVRGINVSGVAGPWSDPLIFAIGNPAVPAAPVILSPAQNSTVTNNQPAIEWTTTPGATEYELYFLQSGRATRITDAGTPTGNGTLEYIPVTPLIEGFTSVWIRAFNPFGDAGPWSTPVGFTVDAVTSPTRPVITAPILDVTTDATPTFRWIGPGANKYDLWVNELPDANNGLAKPKRVIYVTDLVANEYTHFNNLNNATYRVWVRGINNAGEASEWSAFEEFAVNVPLPQTPRLNAIADGQDSTPTFSWVSVSGEQFQEDTTFNLWVNNLTSGQPRVIHAQGFKGATYTPATSLGQGRFRAWVQAVSATGVKSAWSLPIVFSIDEPAPGASKVVEPTPAQGALVVETDKPTIKWDPAVGAATYELWVNHRDLDGKNTVRKIHETGVTTTSYTPVDPLPQGFYKAWVRARNVALEVSEWSGVFQFTIDVPVPRTPYITGPVVNAVGTVPVSSPRITWDTLSPNKDETFDLQVDVLLTGVRVIDQADLTTKFYDVPFKLQETTYRARVRARNSAGEESSWSEWTNFRVDVPNATTPVLLGPSGTVTRNPVTFEWTHARDNVKYEILVRDELSRETIRIQDFTFEVDASQRTAVYTTNVLTAGTYRFWIRSFNAQNTASGWSGGLTFTLDTALLDVDSGQTTTLLTSLQKDPSQPELSVQEQPVSVVVDSGETVDNAESHPLPAAVAPASLTDKFGSSDLMEAVMAEFADPTVLKVLDIQ